MFRERLSVALSDSAGLVLTAERRSTSKMREQGFAKRIRKEADRGIHNE
jgi:hypothetical protein